MFLNLDYLITWGALRSPKTQNDYTTWECLEVVPRHQHFHTFPGDSRVKVENLFSRKNSGMVYMFYLTTLIMSWEVCGTWFFFCLFLSGAVESCNLTYVTYLRVWMILLGHFCCWQQRRFLPKFLNLGTVGISNQIDNLGHQTDNQKRLQTLTNVCWGEKSFLRWEALCGFMEENTKTRNKKRILLEWEKSD